MDLTLLSANTTRMHDAVAAVCPILGISFGSLSDKKTWRINFAPDATPAQMRAAQEAVDALDVLAPPVPQAVTPRQARLALLQAGLLDAVEAKIKTQDRASQIGWEYGSLITRDDPLMLALGSQLGLTDAAIDLLFEKARLIP